MKKALSLLLAAVMALTLCVTAFAGGDTGTRVYLTGDAADEVTGLTSGQRIDAGGSATVRLNVQSDPGAEEYTVKLDGETLKADHSTAQYHVYSLPADKLTARTATLKVMNGTVALAAENGAPATVKVGTAAVALTAGDNNAYTGTVDADETAGMRRIYLTPADGWALYSDPACEKELTKMDAGWTADKLYFYFAAQKQTKTVYAKSGTTTATITLTCSAPAQKFTFSGSYANDTTPAGIGTENSANANYRDGDGTYTGVNGGNSFLWYTVNLYQNGTAKTTPVNYDITSNKGTVNDLYYMGMSVKPDWASSEDWTESLLFHRPGYYPIAVTCGDVHGTVPFVAVLSNTALEQRMTAANNVDTAGLTGAQETVTRFNAVKSALNAAETSYKSMANYANSDTMYVAADGTLTNDNATGIMARDFDGVTITLQRYNEGLECELMDLTALLTTWKDNATQAKYQYQAYQKLTELGLNSYTDVTTAAEKTLYSAVKQAKWDVLHTSGETEDDAIKAVNVVLQSDELTKLVTAAGKTALTAVEKPTEPEKPEYTLGDVDGNGKVEPKDAGLLLQYVNEVIDGDGLDLNAADVDGNGKVEPKDAGYLLQYVNEIIKKLPAEQ